MQVNDIRKQLTVRALQLEMQLIYMAIEAELLLANSLRKLCLPCSLAPSQGLDGQARATSNLRGGSMGQLPPSLYTVGVHSVKQRAVSAQTQSHVLLLLSVALEQGTRGRTRTRPS